MSFITRITPIAVKVMKEDNILASITIAQAILESNWGKSELAQKANNLFGIKGSYDGHYVDMVGFEYIQGKRVTITSKYRKYPDLYACFKDRTNLLKNGVSWNRYKYHNIIGVTDYKKVAILLQQDGYATDPKYSSKLINLIETYHLSKYDKLDHANHSKPTELPTNDHDKEDSIAKKYNLRSIVPYPGHYIKQGSRGIDVIRIQRAVHVTPDGIFGPITEKAVKAYQKRMGLQVDGIVGPITWGVLF